MPASPVIRLGSPAGPPSPSGQPPNWSSLLLSGAAIPCREPLGAGTARYVDWGRGTHKPSGIEPTVDFGARLDK